MLLSEVFLPTNTMYMFSNFS